VIMTKLSAPAIFRFRAKLGTVWRDFDIDGSDTLENLAVAILDVFKFDCDHCYGFYSKLKGNKSKSDEVYELFADQEEGSPNQNAKGVQETIIEEVFSPKKQMLFLFDYGDNWEFLLTCNGIVEPEPGVAYPRITGGKGEAPEQYPPYED
jgi:hypothetical protein